MLPSETSESDSSTEIVNESNTLDVIVDWGVGLAEGMASGGSSGGAETEDGSVSLRGTAREDGLLRRE